MYISCIFQLADAKADSSGIWALVFTLISEIVQNVERVLSRLWGSAATQSGLVKSDGQGLTTSLPPDKGWWVHL